MEPNAQVGHFEDHVLTLAFTTTGLAGAFGRADHADNLRQAIHKTIGIDCQIRAVAGGSNSPASSEPNPKAPASPETPATSATSADVAWGLSPAPQPPASPANETAEAIPAGAPAQAPAATVPVAPSTPAPAGTGVVPVAAPAADPQASVPAAQAQVPAAEPAVESGGPSEASGSYADPDDDWGPPRDEDAPPLDEEPPLDWDPSPAAAPRRPEPAAAAAAPARKAPAAPASKAPGSKAPGSPAAPDASQDASADAWARAVEQSPGVWTVGTNSNVGGYVTPDAEPAPVPEPAPVHYEPAAAQIPEYAGVVSAASGLASEHPARAEAAPAPAVAESVAPRVAAAAVAAVAESVAVAAVPEAAAPAGRQSLYQRLSNSPEAEAGRAKAPARAAAPTVYVQDIPSADDETIEESGVFGRAAVERILGGKLVEERSLDGSPLPPRF